MRVYKPNLDLINVNVYTKFGQILSFHSQDIERNKIITSIKGGNFVTNLGKMTVKTIPT